MIESAFRRFALTLPLAFAVGIPAAACQEIGQGAMAVETAAMPAGTDASAGLLAMVSEEEQPPVSLYGYLEVDGVREHVLLGSCQDVDTNEFLPEGIAVPFICDGKRFTAELGNDDIRFLQEGSDIPVASIPLGETIQTVNGITVRTAPPPETPDAPASLTEALIGSDSR